MSLLSRISRAAVLPAVALATLALASLTVPAANAQTPITPDSGYQIFSFGPVGSVSGPFTFTSGTSTVFTVVDGFLSGDRFRVLNLGTSLGLTSAPTLGGSANTPEEAAADPAYSKGSFQLGPGAYSLTIETVESPFGNGRAYFRLDSARVAAIPEPSEYAAMGLAGLSVCGLMVRARRRKSAPAAA